jgi:hypothetical protein
MISERFWRKEGFMSNPWPPRWNDPAVRYDAGWTYVDSTTPETQKKTKIKHMRKQKYYPSRIGDQIVWLENFRTKLPLYVATLGLVAAKADAAVASARYTIYVLSQWLAGARAFNPAATEAVDLLLNGEGADPIVLPTFDAPDLPAGVAAVPPGALLRIFDLVAEIKETDAYTDAIGQDLGIIGSENSGDHPAPTIKLTLASGSGVQAVNIVFRKFGHMGVHLESRRNGGAWEFLGIDTESPYTDERPLLVANTPEVREYRARFWDKGTPNGDWTDVAKVTVAA